MYTLLNTQIEYVNREQALKYLSYNTYEHQRAIRQYHVDELVQKMNADMYIGGQIVLGRCYGKIFLADGQHTLTAISKTNKTIQMVVKDVGCNSDLDAAKLWQQLDGGLTRSLADHVRSEVGALNTDWSAPIGAVVTGAAALLKFGFHGTRITKSQKVSLLRDHIDIGNFVYSLVKRDTVNAKHIFKQPVVAAIISTYRKDPIAATAFWGKIKTGEMLTADQPEYLLRMFLIHIRIGSKTTGTASKKEIYAKCIKAWNAYRRGIKIKQLKFLKDEKVPVAA